MNQDSLSFSNKRVATTTTVSSPVQFDAMRQRLGHNVTVVNNETVHTFIVEFDDILLISVFNFHGQMATVDFSILGRTHQLSLRSSDVLREFSALRQFGGECSELFNDVVNACNLIDNKRTLLYIDRNATYNKLTNFDLQPLATRGDTKIYRNINAQSLTNVRYDGYVLSDVSFTIVNAERLGELELLKFCSEVRCTELNIDPLELFKNHEVTYADAEFKIAKITGFGEFSFANIDGTWCPLSRVIITSDVVVSLRDQLSKRVNMVNMLTER